MAVMITEFVFFPQFSVVNQLKLCRDLTLFRQVCINIFVLFKADRTTDMNFKSCGTSFVHEYFYPFSYEVGKARGSHFSPSFIANNNNNNGNAISQSKT